MIAESFTPGASVSKVAQRDGVNANLLFTWRRQEGKSDAVGGPAPFMPVKNRKEGSAGSKTTVQGKAPSRKSVSRDRLRTTRNPRRRPPTVAR